MKFIRISIYTSALLFFSQICAWSQNGGNEKEFMFAKKLYDDKLYSLAGAQFLQFAEKFPNDEKADDALFLSGDAYFKSEDYQKAFLAFKELEIKYPNSEHAPEGSFKLAECQIAEGNLEEAAELFKRVSEFFPESDYAPIALLESGKAYARAGNYSSALNVLLTLTANYPDSPQRLDAHLQIVNLYIEQDKFEQALTETDRIFRALGSGLKEPRFYLVRAQIFEKLGQLDEARKTLQKLLAEFKGRSGVNEAYYHLGSIYHRLGAYDKALANYGNYVKSSEDNELKSMVYLKRGDIFFLQKRYGDALENYQKVDVKQQNSLKIETAFKIGRTLSALGKADEAAGVFTKLLKSANRVNTGNDSTEFIEQTYFELVETLVKLNKPRETFHWIAVYKHQFDRSPNLPRMQFMEAEVSEKNLGDFTRALRAYDQFIQLFPVDPEVDAAQLALGRCYEHLRQYELAVQEYQNYLDRYPAGDDVDWVKKRMQLISNTVYLENNQGIQHVTNLFDRVIDKGNQDLWGVELAKIYFEVKDFNNTVKILKQELARSKNGVTNEEVFFYLGLSYFRLAEKSILENNVERAAGLFDSAAVSLNYLIKNYPDFVNAEEADFLLAKIKLDKQTKPDLKLVRLNEFYSTWKQKYPNGKYGDYFIVQLADMNLEDADDNNSRVKAIQYYTELLENFPQSEFFEKAAFKRITAFTFANQDSLVLSRIVRFIENYPQSRFIPEALFLKAQLENRNNLLPAAVDDLQRIQSEYFYTEFARKAQLELAEIRYQNDDFQSALDLYDKLNHYWQAEADDGHLDSGFIIFKQAQAYARLGDFSKALQNFILFTHRYPEHEKSFEAKLEIANIAQQLHDLSFAQEYLKSIVQNGAPSEFKLKAHTALGDILFEEEKYVEARRHYLTAIDLARDSEEQRHPMRQSVRCRYRLKEFSGADSDARVFVKRYQDSKEEEGLFLLDKANAHLDEKNFDQAEKSFKKLKDDYKHSELGAQGEFGLGAVYLITNHTDDALKILTDIPSKYPDSEVTPLTYYNLGDFYFKSQQLENAMNAFKNVLTHPKAGEHYPKALLYLARCYSDARMWDHAIAITRDYVTQFPESEESFRKKIDLAVYLMNLKEYSRSIGQLQELLPYADKESEAEIQFYIGQCYNEMGNFERAVSEYLKVKYLTRPSKLPWHVTALFEAGRCLLRLDKIEQAKKLFTQIVKEQGAESNFGRFARKRLEELENQSPAHFSGKNPGE